MFNFAKKICNHQFLIISVDRAFCKGYENVLAKSTKATMITTAIKLYLLKCNEKENLIATERKEFEMGRKYLAKMMGADPETFTQNDIDESIRYLFPSGLFNKDARPIMTDPVNIYPNKKPLECDHNGRPNNPFYYTARPVFYSIMMEGAYILENLKSMEDKVNRNEYVSGKPISMFNTKWLDQNQLADYCFEKVHRLQYKSWLSLMEAIIHHPYSSDAEGFLSKMRVPLKGFIETEELPQIMTDPETGRTYAESYGQKKWTSAEIRLFMPGNGRITINDKSLLDAVPHISNREAILFPLKFTETVGKVDIVASVKESGPSNLAYAVRLGISRGLSCFLPADEVCRMRLAGLLTQDDRYKERKRPGQPKARKKAGWSKR